ncbi:MAG TPA: tetratricopeptide repeat protein [Polyangiales bacterium]
MTQAPSQASEATQLPTIIIDPSLYEADAPLPKPSARGGIGRLARVTLLTGAVGGATVGLAHLLIGDSFLQDLRVAALTKLVGPADNDAALHDLRAHDRSAGLAQPAKRAAAIESEPTEAASAKQAQTAMDEAAGDTPPLEAAPDTPLPALTAPPAAVPASAPLREQVEPLAARPAEPAKRAVVAVARPVVGAPRVDIEASIRSARRLQALNQLEEAETAYQAVLAQSAGQSAALVGLARIKLSRGQLDAALDFAQRAAREAPDLANVHLTLGDVLRARGDKEGAELEYALAAAK